MNKRTPLVFDRYPYGKRSFIYDGDRFRVSGNPYFVGTDDTGKHERETGLASCSSPTRQVPYLKRNHGLHGWKRQQDEQRTDLQRAERVLGVRPCQSASKTKTRLTPEAALTTLGLLDDVASDREDTLFGLVRPADTCHYFRFPELSYSSRSCSRTGGPPAAT